MVDSIQQRRLIPRRLADVRKAFMHGMKSSDTDWSNCVGVVSLAKRPQRRTRSSSTIWGLTHATFDLLRRSLLAGRSVPPPGEVDFVGGVQDDQKFETSGVVSRSSMASMTKDGPGTTTSRLRGNMFGACLRRSINGWDCSRDTWEERMSLLAMVEEFMHQSAILLACSCGTTKPFCLV